MLEQVEVASKLVCSCKSQTIVGEIYFYDECMCSLEVGESTKSIKVGEIELVFGE